MKIPLLLLICFLYLNGANCLFVSSYHKGYKWDQGVRDGLDPILKKQCEISYFFMDTKRNPDPKFAQKKALEALNLIKKSKPDVVIASDDNASKYLVMPYLKDKKIPVVFCGINTSAKPYGYPYKNATGMVEITPYQPIYLALSGVLNSPKRGTFLSSDVVSQHRMYNQLKKDFQQKGINLQSQFVKTQKEWENAFLNKERGNFIFIGNPAGIQQWDKIRASKFIEKNSNVFTLTAWSWLSSIAMVTITKEPKEQGEWAAKVATAILKDGVSPKDIPVITNRKWNMIINKNLLQKGKFDIPLYMKHIVGEE